MTTVSSPAKSSKPTAILTITINCTPYEVRPILGISDPEIVSAHLDPSRCGASPWVVSSLR